jgi:hypothetical protein
MSPTAARRLLLAFGLACGALGVFGVVSVVVLALAIRSGAGHLSRHAEAANGKGLR